MKSRIRSSDSNHGHRCRAIMVMTYLLQATSQCVVTTAFSPTVASTSIILSSSGILHHHRKAFPTRTVTISSTALHGIVADPPSSSSSSFSSFHREREEEANDESSWTPSPNGGFFAKIPQQIRLMRQRKTNGRDTETVKEVHPQATPTASETRPSVSNSTTTDKSSARKHEESSGIKIIRGIPQVTDILQYKKQVVEVQGYDFVVVRFYAPWCKACRAVERPFRRLHKENVFNSAVKFVEVPVTKENAYLHQGLGIPSLPFAHIYKTNKSSGAGSILVEEMKINKNVFGDFKQTLENYVKGECPITYKDDGKGIEARESSHKNN